MEKLHKTLLSRALLKTRNKQRHACSWAIVTDFELLGLQSSSPPQASGIWMICDQDSAPPSNSGNPSPSSGERRTAHSQSCYGSRRLRPFKFSREHTVPLSPVSKRPPRTSRWLVRTVSTSLSFPRPPSARKITRFHDAAPAVNTTLQRRIPCSQI